MQVYVLTIEYADYTSVKLVFKNEKTAERRRKSESRKKGVSVTLEEATLIED